mmetsp:Transcript_68338/g.158586  ORF Transcript_68338/g.158586 Transcript_68338/m.158586 type:complete len:198 (-) Transcript_68338:116-709(-)
MDLTQWSHPHVNARSTGSLPFFSSTIPPLRRNAKDRLVLKTARRPLVASSYVGGTARWQLGGQRDQQLHSPVRASQPMSRSAQRSEVERRLGYCPDAARRPETAASFFAEFVPPTYRAWTSGRCPPRPAEDESSTDDERRVSVSTKPVEIVTLREYRILKFKGEGDRLLVKRRERGWAALPSRSRNFSSPSLLASTQ